MYNQQICTAGRQQGLLTKYLNNVCCLLNFSRWREGAHCLRGSSLPSLGVCYYFFVGLARTIYIYIRCIHGILGRETTKYTVIYGSGQPYFFVSGSFLMLRQREWTEQVLKHAFLAVQGQLLTHQASHTPLRQIGIKTWI